MSTAEVKEELPVDPEGIAGGLEDLFQNKLPCLVPRAGTYMGFRTPTIEDIAWFGIGWQGAKGGIRHLCRQADELQQWGWTHHDGQSFGAHHCGDEENGADVDFSYLLLPSSNGIAGNVKLQRQDTETPLKVWMYLSHSTGSVECKEMEGGACISCFSKEGAPEWTLHLRGSQADKYSSSAVHIPEASAWDLSLMLDKGLGLKAEGKKNAGYIEFTISHSAILSFTLMNKGVEEASELSQEEIEGSINAARTMFVQRFQSTFPLCQWKQPGGELPGAEEARQWLEGNPEAVRNAVLQGTSNLLGGLTVFSGPGRVGPGEWLNEDQPGTGGVYETDPYLLYTCVPSRPFFPRGFLWDEGFHELLVMQWDPELAQRVLASWLNVSHKDGYIGREQIIGKDARSVIRSVFWTQRKMIANPPMLVVAIGALCQQIEKQQDSGKKAALREFIKRIWPYLVRHYDWYCKTQVSSHPRQPSFRWRGTTKTHSLGSGLDDYPRSPEGLLEDSHLDLLCWMAMFARVMQLLGRAVGESIDRYEDEYKRYVERVHEHWHPDLQSFCDFTVADGRPSPVEVVGYVSLFPLMLGLLKADDSRLGSLLNLLSNEKKLWSPYGIRSVSADDKSYKTERDYWRSAIWFNLNFLTLLALQWYAHQEGPYQAQCNNIAASLKAVLVCNVAKEHQRTGFLWEHFDGDTGKGRGCRPFTGWTALVTLVASDQGFIPMQV